MPPPPLEEATEAPPGEDAAVAPKSSTDVGVRPCACTAALCCACACACALPPALREEEGGRGGRHVADPLALPRCGVVLVDAPPPPRALGVAYSEQRPPALPLPGEEAAVLAPSPPPPPLWGAGRPALPLHAHSPGRPPLPRAGAAGLAGEKAPRWSSSSEEKEETSWRRTPRSTCGAVDPPTPQPMPSALCGGVCSESPGGSPRGVGLA
jgi:hypothetical protein